MPRFFAMTSRGLMDVLEAELKALNLDKVLKGQGGVFFESNWAGCYRANLRLRSATRVLLPILDFPAYKPEELYHNVQKHDFTKYISPQGTIAVESAVRDCGIFRDGRFVSMKIKDAVVDQFREKFGSRPDVDSEDPELKLVVRAVKNQFSLSIDTSGAPLFKRGYRVGTVAAPIKEHVAAGLLLACGWDQESTIVDPMCGSGTFLIEAALMALKIPPGTLRPHFSFQRLKNFKEEEFSEELNQALQEEREEIPFKFYGYDVDRDAVAAAKKNVRKAGLEEYIEISRKPFETLTPPVESGTLIVNPPYGERLTSNELEDTYKDFPAEE